MLRDPVVALFLALSLVVPTPAAPQAAPQATPPQPPGPKAKGFSGSFEGSAVLTNEDSGSSCRYESGETGPPSVRLEIGAGSSVAGSIAIDMLAPAGGACPALRKRYAIPEFVLEGRALSFTDSGGNEWTLSLRENGASLQGLLAWRQGGAEQPLAEGFSLPSGRRPLARLQGEVQLRRMTAGGAGAAAAAAVTGGAGKQIGNIAAIVGANVVGLGLLYGANKLGKGSSATGVVTCSPRTCITGAPNEPCFCEGNVLSGASCGTTEGGAPLNAPCDGRSVPCEASLSCNSGVCEDRFGRCPY